MSPRKRITNFQGVLSSKANSNLLVKVLEANIQN
jgi:hypothetical protein